MNPPTSVSAAARRRIRESTDDITRSLKAIAAGRPGDAETDESRRAAVIQVRSGLTIDQAAQVAPVSGAEKVWGDTIDFVDVSFFERGLLAARSVCRIATKDGQGIGTAFLISPKLLITNNHVIASKTAASRMVAEFDYELDVAGLPRRVSRFLLSPQVLFITDDEDDLDFTVVALGPRVDGTKDLRDFGALPLSAAQNKHALGDIVNIIQHPDGRLKEAVVRENRLVSRPKDGTVIHYVADTEPGSSGAPVFNVKWEVIALHHWGGPHRGLIDEKGVAVPKTVNEGIRASAIVTELTTRKATLNATERALVEEALTFGLESETLANPPIGDGRHIPAAPESGKSSVTVSPEGIATWNIPLTVSVQLSGVGFPREPAGKQAAALAKPGAAESEAKLDLDENYGNRRGYQPGFLRAAEVPLPALSQNLKRVAAKNKDRRNGEDPYELKYEHFSVVMNGRRRLAYFTATNIDGSKAKDLDRRTGVISDASGLTEDEDDGSEASEQWFQDPRIDETEQTPSDFYSGQTTFDAAGKPIRDKQTADHRNRMFQQGHLTRRQDPLWGSDEDVIRAHADTFHVTNRAPQVGFFNMGIYKPASEAKKHPGGLLHWRALEDFVLENARADRKRVTVFTGPIFDDENDWPWARDDPSMEGFKAPREYWKVIVHEVDGELWATALLADQAPLVDHLPELRAVSLSEAKRIAFEKVRKYHVSIASLEARTGLDFGPAVRAADTFVKRRGERIAKRKVETLRDVIGGKARAALKAKHNRKSKRSKRPGRK